MVPIDPGYDDYISVSDMYARPAPKASTWQENWGASIGEMFDEYSSFSGTLNSANQGERDDHIKSLIEAGTIPTDIIKKNQRYNTNGRIPRQENDYGRLAEWANTNLDMDRQLHTDEELKEFRNEEMDMKRKYREDVFSRATVGGKIVGFGGMLVGGTLDPVAIAGGMFTGGAKVGAIAASRALYARSIAVRAGIGGVASQAAVEPFIWAWQEESDGEYTVTQSLANLALAGAFSAGVGGTAGFFGHASALKAEALRAEKIALIEENLAFKGVDHLIEAVTLNHKEVTLGLEKQLDALPEGSPRIEEIQMKLMEEDMKLEHFRLQAEQGPDALQPLLRLFDELEILKGVEGTKLNLEERFRQVEESAERIRHLAHVADEEPVIIERQAPIKKRQKTVIEEKKKAEAETKSENAKNTKAAKKKTNQSRPVKEKATIAEVQAEHHQAKRDLQKLYDDVDSNREGYKAERAIKDLERRISVMEGKIKKVTDPDKRENMSEQLQDWQDELDARTEPGYKNVIDEAGDDLMNERFNTYYNKKISEKLEEIKSLEKELGIDGTKEPIDEAVDAIDEEVVYKDAEGETHHITEEIDEAETGQVVYEDAILCVMRNNLG